MRIALHLLGTEVLALEWTREQPDLDDETGCETFTGGEFELGFTPGPTDRPRPSDVEAAAPPPGRARPTSRVGRTT